MAINNIDIQDEKGNSYRPMANPDSISEFTKAATRTNIASGDTHRTIFGKICKFFADLGSSAFSGLANNLTTTAAGYGMDARQGPVIQQKFDQINSNLDGNRFGHTADGRPGWKDGADTVHPFSAPAIISMIQLLPGLNNYAGNVITLDVSEKNILHVDTMQSWYDDANISIDADGTTLFSKKHQTGGSNRVDTTEIGDIDVSQYELITINFSVVSKNGQGWGKLNNIIIS